MNIDWQMEADRANRLYAASERRVIQLEEELASARAQVTIARNSNGFELLAKTRIEQLEAALREIVIYNDNITKTIRAALDQSSPPKASP